MQTKLSENKLEMNHAIEQAKKQREISISEFFTKNRHLLGFDSPLKAISTTVKESVDNSLDACEESNILPNIEVEIKQTTQERFQVTIEDNGPGIVKEQIPKIFGKLLYGSKFHTLMQGRGQQGIGVSASVLYGQLTTGKPAKITSKISKNKPAYYCELHFDTQKNEPEITRAEEVEWNKEHGTKIIIEMEGKYQRGKRSVSEYIKYTAVSNPHAKLTLIEPDGTTIVYPRATNHPPAKSKEIKPHPDGIELGILINMLKNTKSRTLQAFLTTDFSRIGAGTAKKICAEANINTNARPTRIAKQEADNLLQTIRKTKFVSPQTDCLSPIGEDLLKRSLKKEFDAEFFVTVTRPAAVYRGNPFIIEAGLAYGGSLNRETNAELIRFANKVPLQYQQSACSISKSVTRTKWKQYGLHQSNGNLPTGPLVIAVHMASVWVPFTSESKESIAHYPEIIKEIKLAVQECGRQLGKYVRKQGKVKDEAKKRSYLEKYVPVIGEALKEILALKDKDEKIINENLKDYLERSRKL
ncbi:DNA topoisomerase VI subunit B [archaeon]|nr:DNA topoisomerase VI subunit B [archaeon]